MSNGDAVTTEAVIRATFDAFLSCDLNGLRVHVSEAFTWTFLDPTAATPTPRTCFGRGEIERAMGTWASLGLSTELEELHCRANSAVVILHAPGLDARRARFAADRNFHFVTLSDGLVVSMRACVDRIEAMDLLSHTD